MIVAWRALYIKTLSRIYPDAPCDVVFEDTEWQAIYIITQNKKPPKEALSLNKRINMLTSFGGYLNRKNDSPLGPKAIWIGLQRVKNVVLALDSQKNLMGT